MHTMPSRTTGRGHRRRPERRRIAGFTVTELVVAISIAAVLAVAAVPSFNNLVASQRAKTTASELFASLLKARSEAIMRNDFVKLLPKTGGWNNGWQITDSATPANVLDDRAATGVTITAPAIVTFTASGRVQVQGGTAPTFLISTTSGSTTNNQCISLDLGGRPNVQAAPSC
jgi:type IV fimbrial biogenesis protein FimT